MFGFGWAGYARQSYAQQFADGVRWKSTPRRPSPAVRALMRPGPVVDLGVYRGLGRRPSWVWAEPMSTRASR